MVAAAVKTVRKSWKQSDVARLVQAFMASGSRSADVTIEGWSADECLAKLVELKFVPRAEKATLNDDLRSQLTVYAEKLGNLSEPQRTLAVRYAIRSLQGLLPTRVSSKP